MPLKRYSKKEPLVFVYVMLPYIVFIDILIFGGCIFHSFAVFLKSFGVSAIYFFTVYSVFGSVAVFIKNRHSGAGDLFKRVGIMLPAFYVLNIAAIYTAFFLYDAIQVLECNTRHEMIWWTILYACVMSTVITFINEGMANWEKWKNSLSESEKLNNAYQRSKLLGLKGQINPHFLFNCFNTLSGLIHEDEQRAEKFLDEMTKVHRYMLRSDDEHLVSLRDEIKFADSYLYLAKARFGDALEVFMHFPEELLGMKIPPLSMQVILENIIYTNALNKKSPLSIRLSARAPGLCTVWHSIHEKTIVRDLNVDEGLDNLVTKYRILNADGVKVTESESEREIVLQLFAENAVAS
jgi:sensor histidine kinase YesM